MTASRKFAWKDVPLETLTPQLSRKLITADHTMLAHVYLKKGAVVPAHEHHNEQMTYILEGALRFWLGENADRAPAAEYVDVHEGEVLIIPGGLRHQAHALEDTLDMDIFNPPRQDWLDGSDAYLRDRK